MANSKFTERCAVVATIDPTTLVTSETVYTDSVDMNTVRKAIFTLLTGEGNETSGVDVALYCNTESATDSATWVTTGITSYAQTGVTDNEQVVIEIDAADVPSGKRYVRALLTADADATGIDVSVVGQSYEERYEPVTDLSSVTIVDA